MLKEGPEEAVRKFRELRAVAELCRRNKRLYLEWNAVKIRALEIFIRKLGRPYDT